MSDLRLYHGGIPGLHAGDIITGGHERRLRDDCPICQARKAQADGGPPPIIDGLATHRDHVYMTPNRLYAKHYASLWGYGDLYRVEPITSLARSTEDSIETWHAAQARIIGVYERAVLLTMSERRRLLRTWTAADKALGRTS